jgi:hypothetical protein
MLFGCWQDRIYLSRRGEKKLLNDSSDIRWYTTLPEYNIYNSVKMNFSQYLFSFGKEINARNSFVLM